MNRFLLGTLLMGVGDCRSSSNAGSGRYQYWHCSATPIVFPAPPAVIVMPDTNSVYVVPSIEVDLFFWEWVVVASLGRAVVSLTVL